MNYWLMKSEPMVFSIHHLKNMPNQTEHWDGVRNHQARNMLRDQMMVGDLAFFYHSNCELPGIFGIIEIVREGYPDHTAFDPTSKYYDPTSSVAMPRWYMVDVRYVRELIQPIFLTRLKSYLELASMPLIKKGNRLSVMPVTDEQWEFILSLERTLY